MARADEGTVCEMLQIQNPAEAEMGTKGHNRMVKDRMQMEG